MSKKCIQCGAELEDMAVFCDECGAKQIAEQPKVSQGEATRPQNTREQRIEKKVVVEQKDRNSKMGVASLVFGIIAVCTVGIFFIPEVLGLIFGIIALQNKDSRHNFAVTGIVLSVVAVLVFILLGYIGSQMA